MAATFSGWRGWRVVSLRWLGLGVALALAYPVAAGEYETAANSPDEVRRLVNDAWRTWDFEGAIPYLQRLIEMLGDSKRQDTRQSLEVIYYKLAIAYFFTENKVEAKKAFDTYLEKYQRGQLVGAVNLYLQQLQQPVEMRAHLRRLLELKPAVPEAVLLRDLLKKEESKAVKPGGVKP